MAPDVVFADLVSTDFVVSPENIRRGKLVGRGAFGFVFNGFTKQKNEILTEVALKVLEPIDPGQLSTSTNLIGSARAAFEAFASRWKNDALESCARSYSTARQELNMLAEIRHPHVTSLLGFSTRPMTLIVELAPHGALDTMLSKYRRSNARLQLNTIQHTCVQIAKALEYLHVINHIIYRDLKSENVLIWRFPPPHTSNNQTTMTALDVHVKLGDYGISRYSYPSGVCKGYGGTEGFMAPEIMRYNGEQEYTEKVDCFSFGMFIYELISLKQPYEGHDQMKDFILEGRRPYVSEKELLLPSNLLDLMVICWSENAEFRPSSSQLVGICSAPEFTHLLDVALLKDNEIAKVATMITQTQRDDESNIDSEQITQSCWMLRSSNLSNCSISSLTCSQFGWTDKKMIETTKPLNSRTKAVITAMCQVEETVWMGDSDGNITICLCSNLIEISSFSAGNLPSADRIPLDSNRRSPRRTRTPPSPATSSSVRSILYFEERQMIVVALRHTLLMCRQSLGSSGYSPREDDQMPEFLASIELSSRDEIFHAALIPSLADWQIWTAHANATIFVHHISANTDRLVFSTSVNHTTLQSRSEPNELQAIDFKPEKNVKLLVSSRHTANVVWSALEDDSRVFMWRNSSLRKTLDCCKILPISESLSSMNIEVARESKVTCMALIGNTVVSSVQTSREQLLVGTNRGVIVVVQAIEMLPLTSFRPYNSEIEQILVCDPVGRHKQSGIILNELRQSSKPTQQISTSNSSYSIRNPENTQSMDAKDTVCQEDQTSARQPSSGRKIAKIKQQLYQRGRTNSTDATGPLLDSLSSKGSVFYETVTKGVKDILNTGLPGSSSAYALGSSSTGNSIDESYSSGYFITIGKEYRCLLNRFATVSDVADGFGAESGTSSSDRCAIFWRSDEWIK
ncbi:protein tyrosine kinase domain-containing protein [Ditylenchus destructor]|uniref:Protein tyrosine kinase domain-containing protein n=1 Tax=Ditylenchus destructor TaxID=166010 RepID=A0AAD4R0I7_9BILA|nr:protein tyrosine kinase domain-containing protein [Ditylenchus destructor]